MREATRVNVCGVASCNADAAHFDVNPRGVRYLCCGGRGCCLSHSRYVTVEALPTRLAPTTRCAPTRPTLRAPDGRWLCGERDCDECHPPPTPAAPAPAGLDTTATRAVLDDVLDERGRQHAQWGQQDLPDGTGQPGDRDGADSARKACVFAAAHGGLTYRHILDEEVAEAFAESDPARLRSELLQVAAVAVQWVEEIDRRAKEATDAR